MIWGSLISPVNLISRWVLFFAVAYRAYKTQEKSWVLLSAAFFINAFDAESYILGSLGIEISPDVYRVVSKIPDILMAILLVWGAVHLKYGTSKLKHVLYLSVFMVASYLWLFLLAINAFEGNFTLESIFPLLAYGGAIIYFSLALKRHAISGGGIDALFPWGLILLGALNLTYPFTRNLDWFAPVGFSLGAFFRLIASMGAVKFVFAYFSPVEASGKREIPSGAFLCYGEEEVSKKFGRLESEPGLVMVTRGDINTLKGRINPNSAVFWITRTKEGQLHESPVVYAISPSNMGILVDFITRALEEGYRIVYVDAFEYLVIENGFESALKFLLNVKDRALTKNGTMVLVVNPNALETSQRKILEREFSRD